MKHTTITCATIAAFVLGACAQQEEPAAPVIQGQPIYGKFGSEIIGCEDGIYIPGGRPEEQCLPPDDDCDPQLSSTAAAVEECPPPIRRPNFGADPDRNPEPTGQRDPQSPTRG